MQNFNYGSLFLAGGELVWIIAAIVAVVLAIVLCMLWLNSAKTLKDFKNAETKHRNDSAAAGETRLLC